MKKKRSTLANKLWDLMSKVIRLEASDEEGMAECYTCRTRKHWKELQAGHYINKSYGNAARFEEKNIRVQCESCNVWKEGNRSAYALRLLKEHGQEHLEWLESLKHILYPHFPYEEKIQEYTDRLHILQEDKNVV